MTHSGLSVSGSARLAHDLPHVVTADAPSDVRVSVVIVRALIEVAEQRGVARDALLGDAGLDPASIQGFEARVDLARFQRMFAHAVERTGDPAFGLHFGVQSSQMSFDLVGHLIAHAGTLRQAISACRQFQPLLMDGSQLLLTERAGVALLRCVFPRSDTAFDAHMAEFAAAGLMRLLRSFGGPRLNAHVVSFVHARPAHGPEYTRVFAGAERFRRAFTGIEFASELLDRPHLHAHPELHAVLRAQAERSLERLSRPPTFAERLRGLFVACGVQDAPDMHRAARELGLSVRSLRRKLATEGVSYREVAQSTVKARACRLLRDPDVTVQQTAHALGFADATAFHRAFKRWTGVTPLEWKQAPRGADAQ